MHKGIFVIIISSILIGLLSGCTNIGQHIIPPNREGYNAALLRSDEEQLLLNIVRMKYGDRPYFISIDNVTASTSLSLSSGSIGYTRTITKSNPIDNSYTSAYDLTPSLSYTDSPTVFYSPLVGDKFTKQMLSPIDISTLFLLIDSGWSIARVLRVAVNRVGHLNNALSSIRPGTTHVPKFEEFIRFAHYLRRLQVADVVAVALVKQGDAILIRVKPHNVKKNKAILKPMYDMLGAKLYYKPLFFSTENDNNKPDKNTFTIVPRSFLGILYYLSKSVDVSCEDIEKRLVILPKLPDGSLFDWHIVTQGMFRVYSVGPRPMNANVAVHYRDRWYYIADDDSNSKETLAMIEQLYSIQAGDQTTKAPLVTFNVSSAA